jgi:hypothetical protein
MKKAIVLLAALLQVCVTEAQYNVITLAGTGSPGYFNGPSSSAEFNKPYGMCRDQDGAFYLADFLNHCIRKIAPDGTVSTYAGTTNPGFVDGPAATAKFYWPAGICIDDSGAVYVTELGNHSIRKISASGIVSTVSGTGTEGYTDGPATSAQFCYPRGIICDDNANLLVVDVWNHRLRKITPGGMVSTIAGGGSVTGYLSVGDYIDAPDTAARFYAPCWITKDVAGNCYVADAYNHRIRKIDPSGVVSTFAGNGGIGPGNGGLADGPALSALFDTPTSLDMDSAGNLFINDPINHLIRKYTAGTGLVSSIGSGIAGFADGPDSTAELNTPTGIFVGTNDTIYFSDHLNHAIRMLVPSALGISDQAANDRLQLYPNPVRDQLHIRIPGADEPATLVIYNMNGAAVLRRQVGSGDTAIGVGQLPPGIYGLQLVTPAYTAVKKFIKE